MPRVKKLDLGMPLFGKLYVPAVEARCLTALPTWDGTTSK